MTTANNKITLSRIEQAMSEVRRLESRLSDIELALGIWGRDKTSLWEMNVQELDCFFGDLLEEMIDAAHS